MHGFAARKQVQARFGELEFGLVESLDIGEYYDPDQLGLQFYVFPIDRRHDVIRWQSGVDGGELVGQLAPLLLRSHEGSAYRVEAVCVSKQPLQHGGFEYVFEAQLPAEVTAPARERHGVDSLAAALLLDALSDSKQDGSDE